MPYLVRPRLSDIRDAFMLLTRFPFPRRGPEPRGAEASWAWPMAGAGVGLVAGASAGIALAAGLPASVAAALALAAQALATGALHEDGLADSADGLWGGGTRERRLEIMRDSRIGSYGGLALVLTVLLRWSALSAILAEGSVWGPLVAAGALSRWPLAAILWALPPAREGGLSRMVGRPDGRTLALSGAVGLALALLAIGPAALDAAIMVVVVAALWGWAARARLGGQTGDICGAAQQLAEIAVLLTLAA